MTSLLGLDLALLLGQSIGMPRVAYPARRAKEIFEESILQQPYSAAACTPLPTCRSLLLVGDGVDLGHAEGHIRLLPVR